MAEPREKVRTYTQDELATANGRAAVCSGCEHNRGVKPLLDIPMLGRSVPFLRTRCTADNPRGETRHLLDGACPRWANAVPVTLTIPPPREPTGTPAVQRPKKRRPVGEPTHPNNLSRAVLFRQLWQEIHTRPLELKAPQDDSAYIARLLPRVPCGECRTHWKKLLAELPPDYSSLDAYFAWTVNAHNRVNERLGKSVLTVEEARRHWWPKIDLVYPFIRSDYGDRELMYSLRSVEKFFRGDVTVWVVGDVPAFGLNTRKARFISVPRPGRSRGDATRKVIAALRMPSMGEHFVMMHDDFYFLRPTFLPEMRRPASVSVPRKTAEKWARSANGWERVKGYTAMLTLGTAPAVRDFSVHTPTYFRTSRYLQLVRKYGLGRVPLIVESLYHNLYQEDTVGQPHSARAWLDLRERSVEDVRKAVAGKSVFSHTHAQFPGAVEAFLAETFPEPSCYERAGCGPACGCRTPRAV